MHMTLRMPPGPLRACGPKTRFGPGPGAFSWFCATSQAQAQAAAGRKPPGTASGGSVRPRDAELLRGSAALLLRRLAPVARQRLKAR